MLAHKKCLFRSLSFSSHFIFSPFDKFVLKREIQRISWKYLVLTEQTSGLPEKNTVNQLEISEILMLAFSSDAIGNPSTPGVY